MNCINNTPSVIQCNREHLINPLEGKCGDDIGKKRKGTKTLTPHEWSVKALYHRMRLANEGHKLVFRMKPTIHVITLWCIAINNHDFIRCS